MPILVHDYFWTQTTDKVALTLKLNNAKQKDVDIILTRLYIKVNFPPYISEIFLSNEIIPDESIARISTEKIEFTLQKLSKKTWDCLSLTLQKQEAKELRLQAIKEYEEHESNKTKCQKENAVSRDRHSISEQLQLDDKVREERKLVIQQQKDEFFSTSKDDSQQELRRRHSSTCSDDGTRHSVTEADYDGDGEDSLYYSSTENVNNSQGKYSSRKQKKLNRLYNSKDKKKKVIDIVPPVRSNGTIKVEFTDRVFPTPSRESTKGQEIEILKSSQKKPNDEHGDFEIFRNKALSLFKNCDYEGCVNAFNEAIQLNPASHSLYSNRAAAFIALKKYMAAVQDCTKALSLLTPHSEENKKSRVLCHVRRGTALVELHKYHQAYSEYELASKLDPENIDLIRDTECIRLKLTSLTTTTETEESDDESCSSSISASK